MLIHAILLTVLEGAISQHLRSSSFVEENLHRSQDEITGLLGSPTIWPKSPVFSPESNIRQVYPLMTINGRECPTHRVTYQAFYRDLTPGLGISHTVHLAQRSKQNINPRHLVQELRYNSRSRSTCFDFTEVVIRSWRIRFFGQGRTAEEVSGFIRENNFGCQWWHEGHPCDCYPELCLDPMWAIRPTSEFQAACASLRRDFASVHLVCAQ